MDRRLVLAKVELKYWQLVARILSCQEADDADPERSAGIVPGIDFNAGTSPADDATLDKLRERATHLRRRMAEIMAMPDPTEVVCIDWHPIESLCVEAIDAAQEPVDAMFIMWTEAGTPVLFWKEDMYAGLRGGWDKKGFTHWAHVRRPDGEADLG